MGGLFGSGAQARTRDDSGAELAELEAKRERELAEEEEKNRKKKARIYAGVTGQRSLLSAGFKGYRKGLGETGNRA